MARIRVTQVKSVIDRSQRQKDTMNALGLRKINQSREFDTNPQIMGMVNRVLHLVKVEEL